MAYPPTHSSGSRSPDRPPPRSLPVWPARGRRDGWAPSDWASCTGSETSVSRILALILAAATAEPVRKTNTSTMISRDTRVSHQSFALLVLQLFHPVTPLFNERCVPKMVVVVTVVCPVSVVAAGDGGDLLCFRWPLRVRVDKAVALTVIRQRKGHGDVVGRGHGELRLYGVQTAGSIRGEGDDVGIGDATAHGLDAPLQPDLHGPLGGLSYLRPLDIAAAGGSGAAGDLRS